MLSENPATGAQRAAFEAVISKSINFLGRVSKVTTDPVRKQMPLIMETYPSTPPLRKAMI